VRFLRIGFALFVFLLTIYKSSGVLLQAPAPAEKGSVAGTVLDSSGAVIPGIPVKLTNSAGNAQDASTDEKGEFPFVGLAPGIYTVSITLEGFQPFKSANLDVKAGESTRTEIQLIPANVSTRVNVEGENATQGETQPRCRVSRPIMAG
jgi:hypothetical protein